MQDRNRKKITSSSKIGTVMCHYHYQHAQFYTLEIDESLLAEIVNSITTIQQTYINQQIKNMLYVYLARLLKHTLEISDIT